MWDATTDLLGKIIWNFVLLIQILKISNTFYHPYTGTDDRVWSLMIRKYKI